MNKECMCNLKENTENKIIVGDYCNLLIKKETWMKENYYYIIGEGDGRATLKINYCPICGRELREVTK